jgi:hypothetical protein
VYSAGGWEKWADVDGFFVVKLWCFCGEVMVLCVVFFGVGKMSLF